MYDTFTKFNCRYAMSLNDVLVQKKTGDEVLTFRNKKTPFTLSNFWQWAFSDLVSNTLRGQFAEFIVATALGIEQDIREEWGAYDLLTEEGISIEVKSASFFKHGNRMVYLRYRLRFQKNNIGMMIWRNILQSGGLMFMSYVYCLQLMLLL